MEMHRFAKALRPRIALLDVEMPKLDGLETARQMLDAQIGADIIFLTLHAETDLHHTAIWRSGL